MFLPSHKAGKVAAKFTAWRKLTTDRVILSDVLGMSTERTATPTQHRLPAQTFSEHQYVLACKKIHKLLHIVSSIFLRPKKDGAYRLILNRKKLNASVTHHHFKIDSLNTITKRVTQKFFMASIDMKDAYYSISIKTEHRKFLRFKWDEDLYEFTCLPYGLSCAPRLTKILKPPPATLHKQEHISVAHLDDLILQCQTYERCLTNVIDTIILFDKLSFVVLTTFSVVEGTIHNSQNCMSGSYSSYLYFSS